MNKPSLKYWVYGWLLIIEGLVRVLTFNVFHSSVATKYIFWYDLRNLKDK